MIKLLKKLIYHVGPTLLKRLLKFLFPRDSKLTLEQSRAFLLRARAADNIVRIF